MKRVLLFFTVIASLNIALAQKTNNISQESAFSILKDKVMDSLADTMTCVYACDTVVSANNDLSTFLTYLRTPSFDSWYFFIDDFPNSNWEHPCRHVFVNVKDGNFIVYNGMKPPSMDRMTRLLDSCVNLNKLSVKKGFFKESVPEMVCPKSSSSSLNVHNYAVIINGGFNKYSNHIRYWNDCSYIYSTLVNKYYYDKDKVFVLMSDGTSPADDRLLYDGVTTDSSPLDLDGDGIDDIAYSATPSNVSLVFDSLSNILTQEDTLFIFTMDHGGSNGGISVYLYLWNSIITDTQFAQEVGKVNAGKIIICMGQCYSGGFIDNLEAPNRVIMTACRYDEVSFSTDNLHDDFVYKWTSAMNGAIGADINNDRKISLYESFIYADNYDLAPEHPQYSSTPTSLGNSLVLSNVFTGDIKGNQLLFNTSNFGISILASSLNIAWSLSGPNSSCFTLEADVPSVNQCRITRIDGADLTGSADLTLSAQVSYDGVAIDTLTKHLIAPLIEGSTVPCGHSNYYVVGRPSNSSVVWESSGHGVEYDDPNWMLEDEDPYGYVITNYDGEDIRGTLTAKVVVGGDTVGVLRKYIDTSGGFSGIWYQQPSALDSTNAVPQPFSHFSSLEFVPGRTVYLLSDDFIGATVTHTQNNVLVHNWSNSNGTISFVPLTPVNAHTGMVAINGTYPNSCRHFKFFLRLPPQLVGLLLLSATPSGGTWQFALGADMADGDDADTGRGLPTDWRLTVVRGDTGMTVYESTVSGMSKEVSAAGWIPGVYVAYARAGERYATCKFTVTK